MYNNSVYCNYNSTNTSKVVCIINNQTQYEASYLPEYSMDISFFSYIYTLFVAFGCYSILNPASSRNFLLNTLISLAKYTITGYGLFKENLYKPYMKNVHPRLLKFLNIDDGINEIMVVKNGKVIHTFKTMELFVKNNPIKFVKEFSDDEEEDEENEQEHEDENKKEEEQEHKESSENHENTESEQNQNQNHDLSDEVDYNKKCEQINELIEAFQSHSLEDKSSEKKTEETEKESSPNPTQTQTESNESDEIEESDDTESTHNKEDANDDDTLDDYILDPSAYDFIIRNFYYEDEKTGETHSYVFKYDIFYKSEMVEKYDATIVKNKYLSNRKFIGISLKTNGQKYNINLTSPNNYYVSDNSLFNYSFMKWYMMKHYNVNLSNDYVISCIDNYVEMYRIHPGNKIIVYKNKFEITPDESFSEDDNTDGNTNNDNNEEVDSDSEPLGNEESSSNHKEGENKTDSNNVGSINLEENNEMCDIEILDYD